MGWEWGAGSRRRELDGKEPPVHAGTSAGTPGKGRGGGKQGQLCTSVITGEGGEAAVASPLQCV